MGAGNKETTFYLTCWSKVHVNGRLKDADFDSASVGIQWVSSKGLRQALISDPTVGAQAEDKDKSKALKLRINFVDFGSPIGVDLFFMPKTPPFTAQSVMQAVNRQILAKSEVCRAAGERQREVHAWNSVRHSTFVP